LEREVRELRAFEDIKRLKYRYFRAMTFSDYDTLEGTLTEDVVTSYSDGEYVFEDRKKLLTFLIDSHGPNSQVIAYWMAGMPEITLTSETTATAIWAMYHYFYSRSSEFGVRRRNVRLLRRRVSQGRRRLEDQPNGIPSSHQPDLESQGHALQDEGAALGSRRIGRELGRSAPSAPGLDRCHS
jgi:hypothetical protein